MTSILAILVVCLTATRVVNSNHSVVEKRLTKWPLLSNSTLQPRSFLKSDILFLKGKEKGVFCQYHKRMSENHFSCISWLNETQSEYTLTRADMRNARVTNTRKYAFLVNATGLPNLCITIQERKQMRMMGVESGFLADFPKLILLRLVNVSIKEIKRGILSGLNLTALEIFRCFQLSKIEKGIFEHSHALTDIMIKANKALVELEADIFYGLRNLRLLNLAGNSIKSIPKNLFRDLSQLEYIMLNDNDIQVIHDTFKNLVKLNTFYMQVNPIEEFPAKMLQNLISLENLSIGNINTTQHTEPCFRLTNNNLEATHKMNYIEVLGVADLNPGRLAGVETRTLSIQTCSNVTNLERLSGVFGVHQFSLKWSHIKSIEYDAFHSRGWRNLGVLDLTWNYIETIQPGTFDKLPKLKKLFLTQNSISQIRRHYFQHLHSLTELYLDRNNIATVENGSFLNMPNLEILDLANNAICDLLNISIEGIDKDVTVDLSYNDIEEIKTVFFTRFLGEFKNINLLLKGNKIKKVGLIPGNTNMNKLDLSNNFITNIDGIFSKHLLDSYEINSLDLSNNLISTVQKVAFCHLFCKELILHHNLLKDVSFLRFIGAGLTYIDLSHNKLAVLPDAVITALNSINPNVLNISQNPWICDCSVTYNHLVEFLLKNKIVSCCPNDCECTISANGKVDINCRARNQRELPPCLPYKHVNLYYPFNYLICLEFNKDQKNIRILDVSHNFISKIVGNSLKELSNLSVLNLGANSLHSVPKQMAKLKATHISIENNGFNCHDCQLMETLGEIKAITSQNLSCQSNLPYNKADKICNIINRDLPVAFLILLLVTVSVATYQTYIFCKFKNLAIKFAYHFKGFGTYGQEVSFKRYCATWQSLDHTNIRKLIKYRTTWLPHHFGHYFLERIKCSLRETRNLNINLEKLNVSRELLLGVEYLHSDGIRICHNNINVDTIYIQFNGNQSILKIGDFNQAKRRQNVFPDSSHILTRLLNNQDEDNEGGLNEEDDLQAAARVIFFIITSQEFSGVIPLKELVHILEVELATVVLALQEGMTATQGLASAAFQSLDQKQALLGDLNGSFKQLKRPKAEHNTKKLKGKTDDEKILEVAEANAWLVIGKTDVWNRLMNEDILRKFTLTQANYRITSYVDLLRVIRNILQHHKENPEAFLTALNVQSVPTLQEVLAYFLRIFPHVYPHSFLCFHMHFNNEDSDQHEMYIKSYQKIQNYLTRQMMSQDASRGLKQTSEFFICLHSIHSDPHCLQVPQDYTSVKNVKSSMPLTEVKPFIVESLARLWPDLDQSKVFIKVANTFIKNFFNQNAPRHQEEDSNAKSNVSILEGHCVQVLKPDIKIDIHGVIITREIPKFLQVKALKQKIFSHKDLPQALKKKMTRSSESEMSFNRKTLQNHDFIDTLDFTKHVFHLKYPCISNEIVDEFVRIHMLLRESLQYLQASNAD